jgi:hypothetical protein
VVPTSAGSAPVKTPEIQGFRDHDGGTIYAAINRSQMNDILMSMQKD